MSTTGEISDPLRRLVCILIEYLWQAAKIQTNLYAVRVILDVEEKKHVKCRPWKHLSSYDRLVSLLSVCVLFSNNQEKTTAMLCAGIYHQTVHV